MITNFCLVNLYNLSGLSLLATALVVYYAYYQNHHINDYDEVSAGLAQGRQEQAEVRDSGRSVASQPKWLSS